MREESAFPISGETNFKVETTKRLQLRGAPLGEREISTFHAGSNSFTPFHISPGERDKEGEGGLTFGDGGHKFRAESTRAYPGPGVIFYINCERREQYRRYSIALHRADPFPLPPSL